MVRQSCAIGPCPEKTYNRSTGVKFFNIKYIADNQIKSAWKRKILSTRADIKSESDLHDAVICSRHFIDGDKRNLPTIIPRKVGDKIIWPETNPERRMVVRKQLIFSATSSPPNNDNDTCQNNESESASNWKSKLVQLQQTLDNSPPKLVCIFSYKILRYTRYK